MFVTLKRAPLHVADDLAAIPGVARVTSRVVVDVALDIPGLIEPASGRLISIPARDRVSGATLLVDRGDPNELYRRMKATPAIAGVSSKRAAIDNFRDTIAQNMNVMIFFNVLFSSVIAFGVVYNAARISLSERSRELASLRVLGFTRAEISLILLGELAAILLIAVPAGLLLGYALAALVVLAFDTELYRFPLVVSARTFAFAAVTTIAAALISGLVVRRLLDRLDLVAVLKTRE